MDKTNLELTQRAQALAKMCGELTVALQSVQVERDALRGALDRCMQARGFPRCPEMPKGEGISGEPSEGITAAQHWKIYGRATDAAAPGAGYHEGSDADPRD
jgi:hypothetical protein